MQILKRLLLGVGGVLGLLLLLMAWAGLAARHFQAQESSFVTTFVMDLSQRWDVSDVHERMANELVSQIGTARGQRFMHQFSTLGRLQSYSDLRLDGTNFSFTGTRGVFTFKGGFENGAALVKVTILKRGGAAHVLGLYLYGVRTTGSVRQRA